MPSSTPFERRGSGAPPLVFVHGALCRRDDWRHQVSYFEGAHETVAMDLRGLGMTPPGDRPLSIEDVGQDVAELLEQESLSGVVLVGHSMGCRVVVEAAVRARDRVAGIVLIEGSRIAGEREAVFGLYDEAAAEDRFLQMMAGRYRYMFFGEVPQWGVELLERIPQRPQEPSVTISKSAFDHDQGRLATAIGQVGVPVLMIQSTVIDPGRGLRPIEEGERTALQELVEDAGADYEMFLDSGPGHFVMLEDPGPVNARIQQFIDERISV